MPRRTNCIPPSSSSPFEEERDAALRDFELRLDQRERDEALEEFCDRLDDEEDFWYDEEERHELF